jgi:hypothetical protein
MLLGLAACSNDGMTTYDTTSFSQNATAMFRDFSNYNDSADASPRDPTPGLTISDAHNGAIGSTASGNAAIVAGYQALEVYGGGTGFTDTTPGTAVTGPTSDSVYYVHSSPSSGSSTPMSALNGAPLDVIAQISFLETGMADPEAGLMLRASTGTTTGSDPLDASSAMVFGYVTPQGTNASGNNLDEAGVASRTTAGNAASIFSKTLVPTANWPLNYPEVWMEIRQVDDYTVNGDATTAKNNSGTTHTFQVFESRNPGEAGGWVAVGSPVTIANMLGFDIGIAVASGQSASAPAPNLTDVQVRYVTPASFIHE